MSREPRIFLESRAAVGDFTGAGHLYLVKRNVTVQEDGTYDNIYQPGTEEQYESPELQDLYDHVIQGSVHWIIVSRQLEVNALPLARTTDGYGESETPADRHSSDITAAVLAGSGTTSVEAAWASMVAYAGNIHDAAYDYELPLIRGGVFFGVADNEHVHLANSGATILSVLNHVGVDIRTITTANGADLYLTSIFEYQFPGASDDFQPTLLGQGDVGEIIASPNQESGLLILGRDDVNDIITGTQFQDHYFGEQEANYSTTNDLVTYERLPYDLEDLTGLIVRVQQENLSSIPFSTEPWGLYGVNIGAEGPDFLYGIEEVRLTEFADTVILTEESFEGGLAGSVDPLIIDVDAHDPDRGEDADPDANALGDQIDVTSLTLGIAADLRDPDEQFVATLLGAPGSRFAATKGAVGNKKFVDDVVSFADVGGPALPAPDFGSTRRIDFKNAENITGTDQNDIILGLDFSQLAEADRVAVELDLGEGNDFATTAGGYGDVLGGAGDDVLVALDPVYAPEVAATETTPGQGEQRLRLDGGVGNDFVFTKGGEKALTVGGEGRDWIWNRSQGGVIYGDTFSGVSATPDGDGTLVAVDYDDPANADNFWWWPDTTIKDAQRNDVLQFFGLPLTGGVQGLPLIAGGGAAALFTPSAGLFSDDAFNNEQGHFFVDNFLVSMNYVFKKDADGNNTLYVVNALDGLMGLFSDVSFEQTSDGSNIRGAMTVENYTITYSAWGFGLNEAVEQGITGDLNMVFKLENKFLAALAWLPPTPGLGGLGKLLPLIDEAASLKAANDNAGPVLKDLFQAAKVA